MTSGEYDIAVSAFVDGNREGAVTVKVYPWIDPDQTISGRVLRMFELGSSTLVSALTIPDGDTAAGEFVELVPDAGSAGNRLGTSVAVPVHYGLRFVVNVSTNATTGVSVGNINLLSVMNEI